ncbi:glycerol acyltransferase [Bacteroidia bacterium]|nr:glycerol acyltransferase [Bacteroidia bacterium]
MEKFIDIKEFLASKAPKLAKLIPGFILKWLKKTLHEEQLNEMMAANKDKIGIDFADGLISYFGTPIIISGAENIQPNNRAVVTSNHPLGGMDGVVLISVVGHIDPNIVFPVNDALYMIKNLHPVFARINKYGSNRDNVKNLLEMFSGDKTVLFFPAGLCSRRQKDGTIRDLEWKSTVISQAKKNKRDIIPTFIDARNSSKFYNIAYRRKKLGIKTNIEQLYLVDEGFKNAPKPIKITFGKAIPYTFWDKSHTDAEWAEILKEKCYRLKR